MPRPPRQIPPFFSRREMLQLLFLTAFLAFLVAMFDRIRNPRSWSWLFVEKIDTQLSDHPAIPAIRQFPQVVGEPVLGHQPGDVRPEPAAPPKTVNQVNPLGLQQIEECTEVDQALLRAVKDEIDVVHRKRYTQSEINDLRRQANPALYQLLCVAATTPPEQLAAQSRRDVFYSNLWKDPGAYRGQPIRLRGVLRQLTIDRENVKSKNPYAIDRVYQAWVLLEDAGEHVVVLCAELPQGLAPDTSLNENVAIDAYFVKLYAYQGQDEKWRATPMLVGYQLAVLKTPSPFPGSQAAIVILVLVGIVLVLGIVFWIMGHRDERLAQTLRAGAGPGREAMPEFLQTPTSPGTEPAPLEPNEMAPDSKPPFPAT